MATTLPDLKPALSYLPSPKERERVGDTTDKYDRWKQTRMPHEATWFLSAAYLRGNQSVEVASISGQLVAGGSQLRYLPQTVINLS